MTARISENRIRRLRRNNSGEFGSKHAALPKLRRWVGRTLMHTGCSIALMVASGGTQASECYAIRDADGRNYCLAQTTHDASYCYAIRDGDSRNSCLATQRHERSYCYSIRSSDQRNACLALIH